MSKKILPLQYPIITSYGGTAETLGILTCHEEALDWVYSNYLQFYATQIIVDDFNDYYPTTGYAPSFFADFDNRRLASCISYNMFLNRESGCPYLNVFEVPIDIISSFGDSYVNYIKRNIDMGMYTFGFGDVSKVYEYGYDTPTENSYHPIFIYGYDDETREFNFADFLVGNKYTLTKCSYEEIDAAYKGISRYVFPLVKSIASIQYTDNPAYKFDYSYVLDSVREYLSPDNKRATGFEKFSSSFFSPTKWHTKVFAGINAYDFFIEFMDIEQQLGIYPSDHKPIHCLCDHKEIMVKRIEYFIKKGYIDSGKQSLLPEYEEVRDLVVEARNLLLKHNMKRQPELLARVKSTLIAAREAEIPLLKQIFDV
jgi:hypothetical protein